MRLRKRAVTSALKPAEKTVSRTGNIDEPNPQEKPKLEPFLLKTNQSTPKVAPDIIQTDPALAIIDENAETIGDYLDYALELDSPSAVILP